MTSDTVIAARAASAAGTSRRGAERARREGAERLGRLTERLESIATELTSPTKTKSERTVLRARFAEVQVRVNRLDGIVSGEGAETAGVARLARADAAPDTVSVSGGTPASSGETEGRPEAQTPAAGTTPSADTTPGSTSPAAATPQVDIIA